jgi:hypothetical protein
MDNDLFGNFQDPYDRLEEMEEGLLNHAQHIEQLVAQTKRNALLLMEITETMQELAEAVNQIQNQQLYIYKVIKDQDESSE